jgi:NADPH-dependent 2,4-dienoyl-CoA reductase/sulfur reductase-like enzyme
MTERIVVVGGVAAGMSAAAKAKRTNRSQEVIAFEKGPYISYAACGMPYFLAGDVPAQSDLVVRTPEQMAKQGVDVRTKHMVLEIDPAAQQVAVRDLDARRQLSVSYDNLVIATGARPFMPRVPGSELRGVFGLRSLESGLRLQQYLADVKPTRAVIVGGGYIGVEMAETLRRLGLEVTMLIRSGEVMRTTLDDELRALIHGELASQGVEIVKGAPIGYEGDQKLEAVSSAQGSHPCGIAIIGIGVQPNVELAESAGLTLGATGAIATDERMQTNQPGIYAAGDCAEAMHLVTGKPTHMPLGSTANKQGRVAGENAAGGQARFAGIVGTMVVRCFDLVAASTGLSAAEARSAGFDVAETTIQAKHISHYFPGAEDLHVKLVVDAEDRRLLGGQLVGKKGVAKRIDTLATALYNRMNIDELRQLDLSYAPPFAPVWDPILVAANVAAK